MLPDDGFAYLDAEGCIYKPMKMQNLSTIL